MALVPKRQQSIIYNTRSLCADSDAPAVRSSGGIIFSLLPFLFFVFFFFFLLKKKKNERIRLGCLLLFVLQAWSSVQPYSDQQGQKKKLLRCWAAADCVVAYVTYISPVVFGFPPPPFISITSTCVTWCSDDVISWAIPFFFFDFLGKRIETYSQVSVGFTGNFTILLIIPKENDDDICGSKYIYVPPISNIG